MLAHCKIVDVSVCASQAAARKAQPLWQQLGFQAKIYERKKCILVDQHFNLKQPGTVDGCANRSDTAHHGVAGGGDRGQKRSKKVIR